MPDVNDLDEILQQRLVASVFQPIVDLDAGTIVAYEALARGPAGSLQRPDALYAAARRAGRLAELDELCRITAVTAALQVGVFAPLTLFVNVEPEILDSSRLEELVQLANGSPRELQLVLELTERAIAARPAQLLATVSRLRAAGWRIALDDVGADDMSLVFMPLLLPDVVKLDLSLVQQRPGPAVAEIMNAVNAYAESTGAVVLAEGIEDEKHLSMALALGARLGQGWMFGRPSPSLSNARPVGAIAFPAAHRSASHRSPFGCLPAGGALRVSTKPLLIEISKFLEREAMRFGPAVMVVSTFQQAEHFTPATARRYRRLVDRGGFVAAIGEGLSREPIPGLRGADIAADDPVRGEWDIIVLSPHFAAALLARDLGDDGPDSARRFEFSLTYDRTTVIAATQTLMSRVLPTDWVDPGFAEMSKAAGNSAPLANPVHVTRHGTGRETERPGAEEPSQLDPLTGLLNRGRLQELLESALLQAQVTDSGLAMVHVEIDQFRIINAELGHLAGDHVLRTIADRLKRRFRRADLLARLGNDEFLVLLPSLDMENASRHAQQVARSCLDALNQPVSTPAGQITLTVTIGTSTYPDDGDTFDTLIRAAEKRNQVRRN
ncbi:MAG: EAL domain-containing protein [Nakamurella sp.]